MNSENRKTSDPHRLSVNFTNKMILKASRKYQSLSNISICYGKIWKNHIKAANIKYQLQRGMKDLIDLMNHSL